MKFKRSLNNVFVSAIAFFLAVLVVVAVNLFFSQTVKVAYASPQNVSSYKEAKAYLESVRAEFNEIMSQVEAVYKQVEETTQIAFAVQRELSEKQLQYNKLLKYEYTNSTQFSLISAMIEAESLGDFFKNLDYANSVMDYQFRLAKEQSERKQVFDDILNQLEAQTTQQNELLGQASTKLSEADATFQNVRSKLTPEELAELEGEIGDIGGGGSDPGGGGGDDPGPSPGWSSGLASAYGGSSDPYTPNPGTTAAGDVCDDWSTGVAVPMAWPNHRSYFHHTIKISWNGHTVLATINDCGYMSGGERSLDLQPGVFKAFGFETCQAWGVRQVDYYIM